jgi:hypothetical protein
LPHLKCGTEVKVGDRIKFKGSVLCRHTNKWIEVMREGVIFHITKSESCNARVAHPFIETVEGGVIVKMNDSYVTLSECEKA